MSNLATARYDEVPYVDYVFPFTHPSRVGVVAALRGMRAADPARCRVLELGCSSGANLIPMAYELPESEFVGIELSAQRIGEGRRTIDALGLTNIDLRAGSILDVNAGIGQFDYIICHGVYSWVPLEVREKVIAICKANLAAGGVAYVSYNTYPGWHERIAIRDMMLYHVRQLSDPGERVRQARALLRFLVGAVDEKDTVYAALLRRENDLLEKYTDGYFYHDHLEDVNEPIYFHEFAERAAAEGLQYVGEVESTPMSQPNAAEISDTLYRQAGSLVQAEQYFDFVRNRTFRRTLLCHDDIKLQWPMKSDVITTLHLSSLARPTMDLKEAEAAESEAFRSADGAMQTSQWPLRAALRCLSDAWPAAMSFDALWEQVRARLSFVADDDGRLDLKDALLQCYLARMVNLHLRPPTLSVNLGERPRASALARLQAVTNQPVCNLHHRSVTLNPLDRLVVQLLDGTRGRGALIEALATMIASGELKVQQEGAVVQDQAVLRNALPQSVDASLDRIARNCLLLAEDGP